MGTLVSSHPCDPDTIYPDYLLQTGSDYYNIIIDCPDNVVKDIINQVQLVIKYAFGLYLYVMLFSHFHNCEIFSH